jgi:hypothetical protein
MTETPNHAPDPAPNPALDMFQRMPAIELITKAIGPTVGFHVAGCPDGGYVVIVDGRIRAACTSVEEVLDGARRTLVNHFGEDVPPNGIGPGLPSHDRPRALRPRGGAAPHGPAESHGFSERARASASLACVAVVALGVTLSQWWA